MGGISSFVPDDAPANCIDISNLNCDSHMFEQLNTVLWNDLPQPTWNQPNAIPEALRRLAASPDDAQAESAYHSLLFTIGNNHGGTYFPVVLDVIPFLAEILDHGPLLARLRTLDILIDLVAAFEPEVEYEYVLLRDNTKQPLAAALLNTVVQIWTPRRAHFISASAPRERELANDLDQAINDRPSSL